jgi:CRISPR system Cascade subunit CasE
MFMIDLPLDSAKLMRFAQIQGIPLDPDEDLGYATHAWLTTSLGDLSPRPFRLFERRDGLHLLGYAKYELEALQENAEVYAEPMAMEVCRWSLAAGKQMPKKWKQGQRLGFEVRTCPVSRGERERDVFLSAIERAKENQSNSITRTDVYLEWLTQRMKAANEKGGMFIDTKDSVHVPTVELLPGRVSLVGFRQVRVLRRSQSKGKGKSVKSSFERPDAIFSGDLVIRDPDQFAKLLERGIGRHRAFGFGMLLLRPPER